MRVLVTRPEPGAAATAARLVALGHHVLTAPLLTIEPRDWQLPETPVDALVLTSANAPRLWSDRLAPLRHLPVFAVGHATAVAARRAGFTDITAGEDGASALPALLARRGHGRLLHLAGEERTPIDWPPGVAVEARTVYAALPADAFAEGVAAALAASAIDVVLLFSPRTAAVFASLCGRHGITRGGVAIAAISDAALTAAGTGWRASVAAAAPHEAALFATAGLTSAGERVEGADGPAE